MSTAIQINVDTLKPKWQIRPSSLLPILSHRKDIVWPRTRDHASKVTKRSRIGRCYTSHMSLRALNNEIVRSSAAEKAGNSMRACDFTPLYYLAKKYIDKIEQLIYSSKNTLNICRIQLVFCVTSLGINCGICEPRHASMNWWKVRWCNVFPHLESDSLKPGHAVPVVVSSYGFMAIWLDWGLDHFQAILKPTWHQLDVIDWTKRRIFFW